MFEDPPQLHAGVWSESDHARASVTGKGPQPRYVRAPRGWLTAKGACVFNAACCQRAALRRWHTVPSCGKHVEMTPHVTPPADMYFKWCASRMKHGACPTGPVIACTVHAACPMLLWLNIYIYRRCGCATPQARQSAQWETSTRNFAGGNVETATVYKARRCLAAAAQRVAPSLA